MSAEGLVNAEAIQTLAAEGFWIASSQVLLADRRADIVAVDLSQPETEPVDHPISQLVYAAGRQHVTDVWIAGQHLLADRRLTTLDLTDTLQQARDWRRRIAAEARS